MKGFIAKSALTALLEKVWLASGNKISRLEVKFAGKSAGIRFERTAQTLSATVILPAIDESGEVTQAFFMDVIGYVLHELGHAWFTDNEPWDAAVRKHGKVLGGIVNALEDCREEMAVIRSGYADNARALFVQLANNVFKDGFDNTMIENVAAVIAVEGRRLNGYELIVSDLFSGCPWAEEIADALSDLPSCANTADVVKVAVALWLKIKDSKPDEEPDEEPDGEPDQPEGEEGEEGEGEDKGEEGETPNGDSPSDKPNDEPDEKPEGDEGEEGEGKPKGKPSDKPSDDKGDEGDEDEGSTGSGKGAIKNIQASDLIESLARDMSSDHVFNLPLRTKTIIGKFNWD
jgi:hypothetical protein